MAIPHKAASEVKNLLLTTGTSCQPNWGLAEQFESNEYDVVALGRALIADPMWVEKMRTGVSPRFFPFERKNHSLSGS